MPEEKNKIIAIQGGSGAFHEIAARHYFDSKIKVEPCETFEELTSSISNNEVDYGIMAIENTVGGSLIPNYVLLKESPVKIIGEEYLRIRQNLVALKGQQITDLKEVHSHYMAIAQCRKFFKNHPDIKLVESSDTALSAAVIQEHNLENRGAISSDLAAELYGLEILASGIETNKRNYTRFLILAHEDLKEHNTKDCTKSSLCFSLPHKKGSLSQILSVLAFYELDLTKIQSLPIIGKEFQYFFYLDLSFDNYEKYQLSLSAIRPLVTDLQILGEYKYGIESLEDIHNQ